MPIAPPTFPTSPYSNPAGYLATPPTQGNPPPLPFPYIPSSAPHSYQSDQFNSPTRGIASLTFNGRTWRFRTNPNSITWSYSLITNIEQTYGGRVVQILGAKIDDLVIKVECGNGDTGSQQGGWAYNYNLVLFLRDLLVAQRDPMGAPAVFEYTTRRWKFNVYGLSVPFQDDVTATVRELELHFKVQEDITGVVSGAILDATLLRLRDGIGFQRNVYNSGSSYLAQKMNDPGTNPGGAGGANTSPGNAPATPATPSGGGPITGAPGQVGPGTAITWVTNIDGSRTGFLNGTATGDYIPAPMH